MHALQAMTFSLFYFQKEKTGISTARRTHALPCYYLNVLVWILTFFVGKKINIYIYIYMKRKKMYITLGPLRIFIGNLSYIADPDQNN